MNNPLEKLKKQVSAEERFAMLQHIYSPMRGKVSCSGMEENQPQNLIYLHSPFSGC